MEYLTCPKMGCNVNICKKCFEELDDKEEYKLFWPYRGIAKNGRNFVKNQFFFNENFTVIYGCY